MLCPVTTLALKMFVPNILCVNCMLRLTSPAFSKLIEQKMFVPNILCVNCMLRLTSPAFSKLIEQLHVYNTTLTIISH
jgi:flagellar biosynthesis protein FliQ